MFLGRSFYDIAYDKMVWYGICMVNVDLYSAIITKVSNALNTSGEKPCFQALSKGLNSPAVRGGHLARSSRQWGRAQRMLGVRQWLADVGGPPSMMMSNCT